jgi:chromosome segregation ATPase
MSEQPESRLDQAERLIKELAESDKVLGKRMEEFNAQMEVLRVNIESLHASTSELHAASIRQSEQFAKHDERLRIDGEHIRALVRIAEIHERRLSGLEGDDNP